MQKRRGGFRCVKTFTFPLRPRHTKHRRVVFVMLLFEVLPFTDDACGHAFLSGFTVYRHEKTRRFLVCQDPYFSMERILVIMLEITVRSLFTVHVLHHGNCQTFYPSNVENGLHIHLSLYIARSGALPFKY